MKKDNLEPCHPDWERECECLKKELSYTVDKLKELEQRYRAMKEEHEKLQEKFVEQTTELIRCRGQIDAYQFMILEKM